MLNAVPMRLHGMSDQRGVTKGVVGVVDGDGVSII
jgi:hypothetical protein